MGIKYISGFRGYDNAKQNLRRNIHVGSDLTSAYTVLTVAQGFDQQACFVYLNGSMLKEGTSGTGGDYVLSGNTTITFNTAVATTDIIEVISYNFANPTLPETMIETDHTVTSAESTYHSTAVTAATFAHATDTITKTGQDLNVGDVINVTAATGVNTITTGRYLVKTRTDANNAILQKMDYTALPSGISADGTGVAYNKVFSKKVNNLTLMNKAMVFLNGMLLLENSDFFRDEQFITFDTGVNLLENHVVHIRNFGSFVFPSSSEAQNSGITITNNAHAVLLTSGDLTANTTCVFNLYVSVRHETATNDAYRTAHILCRAEKGVAADCYLHRAYDAGNINDEIEVRDAGNYSTYASVSDGKVGVGVTADSNYWYVYLANRSGHSIVAGFKASAITN
jgi:hypothetical protein